MAAAQRKRWAALKSADKTPESPKRRMSAAARQRIALAAKKRWAAFRAAKRGRRKEDQTKNVGRKK